MTIVCHDAMIDNVVAIDTHKSDNYINNQASKQPSDDHLILVDSLFHIKYYQCDSRDFRYISEQKLKNLLSKIMVNFATLFAVNNLD